MNKFKTLADYYSFYLFAELTKLYNEDISIMEYDIQFYYILEVYEQYEQSKYNIDPKGEYECIINFLIDKYKEHQ